MVGVRGEREGEEDGDGGRGGRMVKEGGCWIKGSKEE